MEYDQTDPLSIEAYAKRLLASTLREVVGAALPTRQRKGKGGFGQDLETYYFGINPGNSPLPDFPDAGKGVELKTFPIDQRKNGRFVAGERVSLSQIDYDSLVKETWRTSSFLKKNALLLLVAYLRDKEGVKHVKDFDGRDAVVKLADLWDYPDGDIKIIQDDWERILKKVRDGKAHEISEGDTLYLGAAPKAQKGSATRSQPFGPRAKCRALTLKQSYLTTVVERLLKPRLAHKELEAAVKNVDVYKKDETFEQYITRRFAPYIGLTTDEINAELQMVLNPSAKNYVAVLTRAILGVRGRKIEEFEKAGVVMKTIRLEVDGVPKESMSFPAFRYRELVQQAWDTSDLKNLFERRFFFVVFKKDEGGHLVLTKVMFWTMPMSVLEKQVKTMWRRTVQLIKDGKIDALPRESESDVCHVRPHAQDKSDTDIAPNGRRYVKKCFWLNRRYVANVVADK